MPLPNYTTTVAAETTIGEIMGMLGRAGATAITINYDGQRNATALAFTTATAIGPQQFRLPANVDAIWRVLVRQNKAGQVPGRFLTREQAGRIAWRIIRDWVRAQLGIIETEMATLPEVMFPYMVGPQGATVYEVFERGDFLLPPGREDVKQ